MVKKKLYNQSLSLAYAKDFAKVTRIFGIFLMKTNCKSKIYNDIIETWSGVLLPHNSAAMQDAVLQNEDIL